MLKQACIALAISTLVFGLGGRPGQAGWSDAGSSLTLGASSPLFSVKKNKKHHNDDDDDNHHANDDDQKKDKDNVNSKQSDQESKGTTNTTTPKCDWLYCNLKQQ